MICAACGKQSLPGGVRCIYCGVHFPVMPDFAFDVGSGDRSVPTPIATQPRSKAVVGGMVGSAILLAGKAKALLALFKLAPMLMTLGSMWLWIQVMATRYGWSLAAGLAVCILIHEMGHVVMNARHGIKASAPMFIPFFGALITVKEFPADPTVESECGAGGPVAGALAAVICALIAAITQSPFWSTLALLGFGINLFNLIPVMFLDGARISTVFANGNWDFVLLATLLLVIKLPSVPLWGMLVLLFILRLGRPREGRFQLALPTTRARMAVVYLVLLTGLCYGVDHFRAAVPVGPGGTRAAVTGTARPRARASRFSALRSSSRPNFSPETRLVARIVVAAVCLLLALVGWVLTPFLLFKGARERMDQRGWLLTGGMLGLLILILALGWVVGGSVALQLMGAYLIAMLAACVLAIYRASHAPRPGDTYAALSWHCLATTALTALVMAYWWNSLPVAALLLVCTAVFYARRPWLLLSLLARAYEALGRTEQALEYRERALRMKPEPEAEVSLWQAVAASNLSLARGEAALEAMDRRAQIERFGPLAPLANHSRRAAALAYQDRYDEALTQCEELLRTPVSSQTQYKVHLAVVRELLGGMALYRGWTDEACAQAATLERELPPELARLSRVMVANSHRLRAKALAVEGRLDEAEVAAAKSLEWDRSGAADAIVALIRGQVALQRGEKERAERETASAFRRLPGNLEVRFWRACALRIAGDTEGADALLRDLAQQFPHEHWGRQAAQTL